jgi:hypothetical protein
LNSTKKYDKRVMCVTNYAVFLLHPTDAFMARALEITDITKIYKHGDTIGLQVPKEFDVIVKTPKADEVVELIQSIYTYKKKSPLDVVDMEESRMLSELQLKKPNYWKPELRHVHSKEELYNRLVAMNNEDDQLAYLNLKIDPRTQLGIVEVQKEVKHLFTSGPFKTDPLLHYFGNCLKINSRGSNDTRFVMITNSCLYLSYTNGNLQRCILLHKPTQLFTGPQHVALTIPDEFDLVLKLPTVEDAKKVEHIIKTIYEFKMQKPLVTVDQLPETKSFNMNKPKGWTPRFAPVLQRKDLIEHLRKLGVRPDMSPEVIKEQMAKHSDQEGLM